MTASGQLLLLLVLAATPVTAGNFSYTAVLSAASPTFDRPNDNGLTAPTSLSGVFSPYSILAFQVSANGSYSMRSDAPANTWNNFLVLYANSFDQAAPLNNATRVNDNFSGGNYWNSRIDANLVTDVTYFLVTTSVGFLPQPAPWTASNQIQTGGASIIPVPVAGVPEPSTYLLVGSALLFFIFRLPISSRTALFWKRSP